jgi:predicted nucleic acid-binding protein
MKIVIDSYAWVEHFLGSKKGQKKKEILDNADEVYTPDFVLAEIARKYVREKVEDPLFIRDYNK